MHSLSARGSCTKWSRLIDSIGRWLRSFIANMKLNMSSAAYDYACVR